MSYLIKRLNDRRVNKGEAGVDAGFTLIELMVVLLIMAILLAIAIPTFLGVSGSANDRASQSNLNTALTNAKSYYDSNGQGFGTAAAFTGAISTQEPSLSWVTTASTGPDVISVDVTPDGNGIVMASLAKTNTCWYLVDNETLESGTGANADTIVPTAQLPAGTWYGSTAAGKSSNTTCTADSAASATSWNAVGQQGFQSAP